MSHRSSLQPVCEITDEQVRQQLDRVLNSKTFQHVQRLKRFMTFVVLETKAGRGDQLKEFVVGVQVFDKEASFDPRNDPIVRVQARRLRTRLAAYYAEEGQNDEIFIELPKGGYAVVFKRREPPAARKHVPAALARRNTIAVMPFADHSAGHELDYFCQGIREEIIHALSKLDTSRVVARDLSQFSTGENSLGESGLHAGVIVAGSVRKSGDDLRVTAQLIDGANGNYLWSESFDRKNSNIFAIQEEVAQSVLKRLQAGVTRASSSSSSRNPTENLAAYNFYVQGRYHLSQRTEEGLRKAIEFFDKVIAEDPRYAQAYSGLADAYELLGHYGVLAPADVWTKAASNAAWAVLQDENSAEAHTSLAHVKSTQDWDWLGAEQEFKRAIELDSRYPTAHHWYAVACLAPLGRVSEALNEIMLAHALDPISLIIARDVAIVHYYARDFEAALDQCDHTIELNPHFAPAYWALGLIQEQMSDFEESLAAFQRAIQLTPNSPRMRAGLARSLAMSGKHKEAQHILKEMQSLSEKRYVSPFELASVHFALGQSDVGFEWLKKAFQDRCFELISINVDPRFDSIKSDPRFAPLQGQMKL
ncbi:MAG TPA: tetratricopeptide repeat protein [Candidatus Aquilonibacter sp.]|nr:tetratricopeptide repeat protein [Candidatus Aquilonibacter sp.]